MKGHFNIQMQRSAIFFLQSNVFFLTCVKFVFAKHVVQKAKTYFYVYIF